MKIKPRNQTVPPTDVKILDSILAAIKDGRRFCLTGHQNPDGDVIGSELAMAALIRKMDPSKYVVIQNCGAVPKSVAFLPGADTIKNIEKTDENFDVMIVFECSGAERTGNIVDFKKQVKTVINIDHHLHNPNFGHINFVEPATSSTAELIFKIFERSGLPMGLEEAACIYTGIVTDTGWFRYSNTNVQTMTIASKLLSTGLPTAELAEKIYLGRSEKAVRLLAWTLSNMKLTMDNRVAVMAIPEKIFESIGATSDDTEELVNYGLQIESVCASVYLREKSNPPHIKVSLRSKGEYDINQIARTFGGGGHKNASGCKLEMDLESAQKALLKEMPRIF